MFNVFAWNLTFELLVYVLAAFGLPFRRTLGSLGRRWGLLDRPSPLETFDRVRPSRNHAGPCRANLGRVAVSA